MSATPVAALIALCSAALGCGPARGANTSDDARALAEYDLARDALGRDRLREALDHVEKSLKIEETADAAYLGAVIYLQFCAIDERSSDCRFNDAERYARRALDLNAEHRDAKNVLGVILIHMKRPGEAVTVLKPLAEDILYPSPEKAWGNLGWAYLERGSIDEAIDALRRAVAAQPLFCVGHYRLGLAYEKKGELAIAREAYTRSVSTERPECKRLQDAYGARARVLAKQGLKDEARADLERCRELSSATPTGRRCVSELQAYQ